MKLHKSSKEYVFAGVCGGLSETLEIDVTIIRLLLVIAILCFGTGFLLYLILAFVMPTI